MARIVGKGTNARFVFVMDRIAAEVGESPEIFGIKADNDQLVIFESANFQEIGNFFEKKRDNYKETLAIIYLFVGQDDISEDVDDAIPVPLSSVVEGYFDARGPRQIPGKDIGEVRSAYESLVQRSLDFFPTANIITSNPAPRRLSEGFAVRRAMFVASRLGRQDSRHHHFSTLRMFHGKRKKNVTGDRLGGNFPILEHFFHDDGVRLTRAALSGVIVRTYVFLTALMPDDNVFVQDPRGIEGLIMMY